MKAIFPILGALALSACRGVNTERGPDLSIYQVGESVHIFKNGELLGGSDHTKSGIHIFKKGEKLATITRQISREGHPRNVSTLGTMAKNQVHLKYLELAPPMNIHAEGLAFSSQTIQDALKSSSSRPEEIARIFQKETGREINKYYEVSGRTDLGTLFIDGLPISSFYGEYSQVAEGAYKIHKRGGSTLEQVDTIVPLNLLDEDSHTFKAHRCGNWGYSEGNPRVILDEYAYSASVYRHYAKGFINKRIEHFPKSYMVFSSVRDYVPLKRASLLGTIDIEYDSIRKESFSPFNEVTYTFSARQGSESFSWAVLHFSKTGDSSKWDIWFHPNIENPLERLDQFLAALPAVVIRGDGIRDSVLGLAETGLDLARFIQSPSPLKLSDFMSPHDVGSTHQKVKQGLKSFNLHDLLYSPRQVNAFPHVLDW